MGPTLAQILATGNLKVKVMIPSGETNVEAMETLGNKVLGYKWHATDDVMAVALPINTSGRVRKIKQRPDVTEKDLAIIHKDKFSKSICLSLVNCLADFIEIAAPYLLNFRLLMKQIFENKSVGWNDEIPEVNKRDSSLLKKQLLRVHSPFHACSTRSTNPVGGPMIVLSQMGHSKPTLQWYTCNGSWLRRMLRLWKVLVSMMFLVVMSTK